jgi:ATP-binding cassette subfamily B protein
LAMVIGFALMHFPINGLLELRHQSEQTDLAASRIFRYLDQIPEVGQAVGAKFLQPMRRAIQYESVGYSIPNHGTVLKNFDLKIAVGEKVAFVSLDPLESQAAAALLPRFIEPSHGRILYDGEDIAWVTLESLRAETTFVASSDSVFSGTVLQNITCGASDYSLQQATDAARMTHAHNFVIGLPNGYETVLGDHGEQLDAGQAFRLALARAVVRTPALMIIEEPTQQLDDAAKSWIEDAYARIARDRTVIFLPTRLSTVRKADRIVVIHQGRVEAIGNHDSLVRSAPVYRHWEYVHFNEFRSESPKPT